MRANFDNKLSELNKKLLSMAAMTEQIIAMSIKSLEEQDTKLARETVEFDAKINEAEREVERICLNLLLQQQPVFAEDLRRVSAALKMITDIERVGDQSADIADLNIRLIKKKQKWDLSDISEMARAATQMVNDAIDAYVNDDENLARKVISSDDKIDELFVKTKDKIIDEIAADKANGEKAIDTLMVAKYFERIGDHASDIAEIIPHLVTVRKEGDPAVSQAIRMGQKAHKMILDALNALTSEDEQAALRVIAADDEVDYDFNAIKHTLAQEIAADPGKVDAALDLLMVIKYLERIGDHAVNLAEWVEFVRSGRYHNENMF